MKNQFDTLKILIAKKIEEACKKDSLSQNSWSDYYDQLVDPPNPEMGDFAFGCFQLAKSLKMAPPQIAQKLKSLIQAEDLFSHIDAAGPYLNFKFHVQVLGQNVLDEILNQNFFKQKLFNQPPKIMIEYSQPNTHKEIHVGHMRNACLGDAVVKLHRYSGFDVISSTFPGDVGTHVAKCLWYMKYHNKEAVPEAQKGEWLGRMYSQASIKLEDELGSPQEEKNREQLTKILKQLEAQSGEYFDLWKETRQWSVDLMNSVYKWADMEFDKWYWESDVDSPSVKYVKSLLEQGKLTVSQGAVGMDLESDNLGFCLLLKSDGTGLYATKDIELARRKFQDFKIEKSIYVVDLRQALHFKQVFKTLEKLGFEQAKDCFHLQYNFVELPDGAMSSRKGNIVPLMKLVEEMQARVKSQYLARYEDEWTEAEKDLVASQVAKGAIKYGMLKIDTNKKIVFDLEEWLKIDGDSGPFIQYSCARIKSLLKKLGWTQSKVDYSLLSHPSERKLIQHLIHFNQNIFISTQNYKPAQLCSYLYDLSKRFNAFYHDCSVGQAETETLKQARLALSASTGIVLEKGLSLLGIPTPERM